MLKAFIIKNYDLKTGVEFDKKQDRNYLLILATVSWLPSQLNIMGTDTNTTKIYNI